ncbi:hypothetical protein ABKN59_005053 [Abortiporus biennis]
MASPSPSSDNGDLETQQEGTQLVDEETTIHEQSESQAAEEGASEQPKQKRKREPAPINVQRDPGKSLLPFSRVQRILKADKELPIVAREATYLISLATEEFIKRIAEESSLVAQRESRVTVQYKDIANVVRRVDKYMFLDEIVPFQPPPDVQNTTKRTSKSKQHPANLAAAPTMLDAFVKKRDDIEETQEDGDGDVVMNDDGTMSMG